jgi:potassium-transporting ATPase KdpC subunit
MIKQLKPAIILFVLLTLITGIVYPMLVTVISQTFFSYQANGSPIVRSGKLLGSELIGQNFTSPQYFWGRPSATSGSPYNSFDKQALTGSSGSNLGPLSKILVEEVQKRVDFIHKADPSNTLPIPVDLVTSSASGLDPDISLSSANYQASRIARARGISESSVFALIAKYSESRQFGFLGEPRVNVLILNLALDGIE